MKRNSAIDHQLLAVVSSWGGKGYADGKVDIEPEDNNVIYFVSIGDVEHGEIGICLFIVPRPKIIVQWRLIVNNWCGRTWGLWSRSSFFSQVCGIRRIVTLDLRRD